MPRKPGSSSRSSELAPSSGRSLAVGCGDDHREARLRTLIDQNLIAVTKTLHRRGVPLAELDGEVQRTFVIVARRLGEVDRIERRQIRKLLDRAIERIQAPLCSVLLLAALDGLTATEIAALLGVPRRTVASRLRRARTHLRKQLAAIGLAAAAAAPLQEWKRFTQALRDAGIAKPVSRATRAKVLAALALAPVSTARS
jgi:RNA polymerase sigma factor (sigma-70 family)